MNKELTDILLIRKYLNGELDANAMHQFEKRAQDDPFLMDAIEGYEKAGNINQQHLDELHADLNNRVRPKKIRIIQWKVMAVAASVFIVCCTAGLYLFENAPVNNAKLAGAIKPAPVQQSAMSSKQTQPAATAVAVIPNNTAPRVKKSALKRGIKNNVTVIAPVTVSQWAMAAIKDSVAADSTPLDEMIVMDYTAQKSKEKAARSKTVDTALTKSNKRSPAVFSNQLLAGKVAGVTSSPTQASAAGSNYLYNNGYLSKNTLYGRVIGKDDGMPIHGASIRIAGTNKVTQTDADGRFKLAADSGKANQLIVGFVGYETQKLTANSKDSIKTIAMVPASSSLSEVVVMDYTSKGKTTGEPVGIKAHPQAGWYSYNKYLKENAISPDGKSGIVKIAFTVDHQGNITDVKVIKGLSTETDRKAISLISSGPAWTGNSNGLPQTVTVKVEFANN